MKKVLVHMCCGPCSIYPLKTALKGELEVVGYFYNPNIQPRGEHDKRRKAVETLSRLMEIDVIFGGGEEYDAADFVKDSGGRAIKTLKKEERCRHCYTLRLEAVAGEASLRGFDYFSSSLFYSKYQNHDLMLKLSGDLADKYGISLFYRDFRLGWKEGIKESKEMGLYRQQYCGCIYSWMERYNIEPKGSLERDAVFG